MQKSAPKCNPAVYKSSEPMPPTAWESGLCQKPLPPPSYVRLGRGWKLLGTGFALALLRSGQGSPPAESVAEEVTGWSREHPKSQHLDTAAGLLPHNLRGENQAERGTGNSIKKSGYQINSTFSSPHCPLQTVSVFQEFARKSHI